MMVLKVIPANQLVADDHICVSNQPWVPLSQIAQAPLRVFSIFHTGHSRVQAQTELGTVWFDTDELICVFREAL